MVRDFSDFFRRRCCALILVAMLGAAFVAGCGVKGPLKLPPTATGTPPAEPVTVPAPVPPERKP